ncbi:MAG: response regulator [Verrucomicrobiae bacterium]|nr:response regulator [Verrucomicrobiae bacterium]
MSDSLPTPPAGSEPSDPTPPEQGGGQPAPTPPEGEEAELLSNLRHSLRTPLNQIIGYCELMLEELENYDDPELLADLRKIHTAGGQLLSLINEALAPWRLESDIIDLDYVRMEMRTPLNLIIGYSELCQELAEENRLERVLADLQKVTGAAKNLLALLDSVSFPSQLDARKIRGQAATTVPLLRAPSTQAEAAALRRGTILIVDDNEMNRDMLCRRLERQGHTVMEAENGLQALQLLRQRKFDLILLDVVMPELGGLETLQQIIADPALRHIPVIMLSALDEMENVIRCVEIGADDYVTKPFNPVLLNARIAASLEKKRLRDQERNYFELIETERQKAETLLRNILPESIAQRLKQGESSIADQYPATTVLVADVVGFSVASTQLTPAETVELLNDIVSQFDWLAELHGLEKIKTIVDKYLAVAGAPVAQINHATAAADMALEMQKVIKRIASLSRMDFSLRIGICSGPLIGGVIGRRKFIYDIWGDTVRIASALESQCPPGQIRVAEAAADLLKEKYQLTPAEPVSIKRCGDIKTFYLQGRLSGRVVGAAPRPGGGG